MFVGEYQHTLDAKGRVSLPAKFRSKLTGSVTVAKGLDDALYVFPPEEYERFTSGLLEKADFDPRVRSVRRYFMAGADEVDLDSAGRISLPQHLRDHAGLSKDVAVIGNGGRIELWDSAHWAEYNGATAENVEDLAQELAAAGLL